MRRDGWPAPASKSRGGRLQHLAVTASIGQAHAVVALPWACASSQCRYRWPFSHLPQPSDSEGWLTTDGRAACDWCAARQCASSRRKVADTTRGGAGVRFRARWYHDARARCGGGKRSRGWCNEGGRIRRWSGGDRRRRRVERCDRHRAFAQAEVLVDCCRYLHHALVMMLHARPRVANDHDGKSFPWVHKAN